MNFVETGSRDREWRDLHCGDQLSAEDVGNERNETSGASDSIMCQRRAAGALDEKIDV